MIIGRLNKKIAILEPINTPDGQGGYETEYALKYSVWGGINISRSSLVNIQGAVSSDLEYDITIRAINKNLAGWRVEYNEKCYEILHSYEDNFHGTVLKCREIVRRG